MDCSLQGILSPWNSLGKSTGMGCISSSNASSRPSGQTNSPTLWADSLPSEPPGLNCVSMTDGWIVEDYRSPSWISPFYLILFVSLIYALVSPPKSMSIELVMPSNHSILCRPLLLLPPNPSQHQGLFRWVSSSHQVAKVLEFQLQHQSFQWTPRTYLL